MEINVMEILDLKNPRKFVEYAEEFVKRQNVKSRISTNQLRNIYEYILKIKDANSPELYLLKPKLAYLVGRKNIPEQFRKEIENMINNITKDEQLENFKKFMEAVVAYNKIHGGN